MSNIRDLDRPLQFGNVTQIRAVHDFEAGMVACHDCGTLKNPDPEAHDMESDWRDMYCISCYDNHICAHCGEWVEDYELEYDDMADENICWACAELEEEAP